MMHKWHRLRKDLIIFDNKVMISHRDREHPMHQTIKTAVAMAATVILVPLVAIAVGLSAVAVLTGRCAQGARRMAGLVLAL